MTDRNASLSAASPLPSLKERVQALRDRYPYQFSRAFEYGLAIEHGWLPIIEYTCEQIDAVLEDANIRKQNFSFLQIKEKLGTLRMAWDRAWNVPQGSLPLCDHEPKLILPDSIPEDPQYDECKQTIEEYLASPRAREWAAMHMIPNPALANIERDSSRYFDRLMSVDFEQGVSSEEMDFVTHEIAKVVMVPEEVTLRIREIIEAAEQQASITCQFCGAPGIPKQLDGDGWIVVGCEKHGTRKAVVEFNSLSEGKRDV